MMNTPARQIQVTPQMRVLLAIAESTKGKLATLTLNAEFHGSAEAWEPHLPLMYRGASQVMRDG